MAMTSSSRMRMYSCSPTLSSWYMKPNLLYSTVSPAFSVNLRTLPAMSFPSPTETTSPEVGRFIAETGSRMPPRVFSSAFAILTSTLSPWGMTWRRPMHRSGGSPAVLRVSQQATAVTHATNNKACSRRHG